jgi:hypothetical protein
MEIVVKRIILTLAAIAMTSGVAFSEGISSRHVYGDAPPKSVVTNPHGVDYSATASIRSPGNAAGAISSRYVNGDAPGYLY